MGVWAIESTVTVLSPVRTYVEHAIKACLLSPSECSGQRRRAAAVPFAVQARPCASSITTVSISGILTAPVDISRQWSISRCE
jgi:hypothetical protein